MKIDQLKPWSSIGIEEEEAALRVLRSGTLSGFLGGIQEGGPEVTALEKEWAELNGGGYSVAVNSATSGILIALKAVGVEAGHKVICSPYSMSAGVAAILWCGAEPVFVDIGDDYCLNPYDVSYAITEDTVAILTTNLFGGVGNSLEFSSVPVIEDNAQAPLTHTYYGEIAVDSFNCHKPMQAGEGGICTAEDPALALSLKMLRNHGELGKLPYKPVGQNLRMTEITAAIAREQVKKGQAIIEYRRMLARRLVVGLSDLPSFRTVWEPFGAHYVFPIRVPAKYRDQTVKSLQERDVPVRAGYGGPLYGLPAFKQYAKECPNCEKIESQLIVMELYAYDYNTEIIDQIIDAFHEVSREVIR